MNQPIDRPKCKHWPGIPPCGAVTTTLDPAAMLRALTTCDRCEIERLTEENARLRKIVTGLAECGTCGALSGDPCRNGNGDEIEPHRARKSSTLRARADDVVSRARRILAIADEGMHDDRAEAALRAAVAAYDAVAMPSNTVANSPIVSKPSEGDENGQG